MQRNKLRPMSFAKLPSDRSFVAMATSTASGPNQLQEGQPRLVGGSVGVFLPRLVFVTTFRMERTAVPAAFN